MYFNFFIALKCIISKASDLYFPELEYASYNMDIIKAIYLSGLSKKKTKNKQTLGG